MPRPALPASDRTRDTALSHQAYTHSAELEGGHIPSRARGRAYSCISTYLCITFRTNHYKPTPAHRAAHTSTASPKNLLAQDTCLQLSESLTVHGLLGRLALQLGMRLRGKD